MIRSRLVAREFRWKVTLTSPRPTSSGRARWRTEVPCAALKALMRQEAVGTQDHMSCQGMEVDDGRSLEEMGFGPSAVGEPLGVKHMCDKKCGEMGFKF